MPDPTVSSTTTDAYLAATSVTVSSVTVAAGESLFVWIHKGPSGGGEGTQTSTVDWNTSESLTLVDRVSGTERSMELWQLLSPTATTADIVADFGGASTDGGITVQVIADVDSVGTPTSTTHFTTTPSVSVTSVAGDLVIDGWVNKDATVSLTVDASQTEHANYVNESGSAGSRSAASSKSASGTSTTMAWTLGSTTRAAQIGVALTGTGAGATPTTAGGINRGLVGGGLINNGLIR